MGTGTRKTTPLEALKRMEKARRENATYLDPFDSSTFDQDTSHLTDEQAEVYSEAFDAVFADYLQEEIDGVMDDLREAAAERAKRHAAGEVEAAFD